MVLNMEELAIKVLKTKEFPQGTTTHMANRIVEYIDTNIVWLKKKIEDEERNK